MYTPNYAIFLLFSAKIMTYVKAQFAFTVDDTDADAIYLDIQAIWDDWADAGNQALGSALTNYPDAWSQLTTVYGTDSIPTEFDPGLARMAANALAGVQQTTIWDGSISDRNQYSFEIRELEPDSSGDNSEADTAVEPTTSSLSTSDDSTLSTDASTSSQEVATTASIDSISTSDITSSTGYVFVPAFVLSSSLLIACAILIK